MVLASSETYLYALRHFKNDCVHFGKEMNLNSFLRPLYRGSYYFIITFGRKTLPVLTPRTWEKYCLASLELMLKGLNESKDFGCFKQNPHWE